MLEEVAVVMSMLVLNDTSGPYDSEILGTSSKVFADKIWRFSNSPRYKTGKTGIKLNVSK